MEELRTLQGEVLRAVHRDEAVDAKIDNLNAENKRLAKKIRNVFVSQSSISFPSNLSLHSRRKAPVLIMNPLQERVKGGSGPHGGV